MEPIRLLSTSMVQASTNKVTTLRIDLTQCDIKLLTIGVIQKGLLFLNPLDEHEIDQSLLIQRLKTSLSRTLDFFTPLTGRLATTEHDDNTVSYFIDCNDTGAQFVHAVADGVTIADILEPVHVPAIVNSFFRQNGVKNYEGVSKPLLAIQITELVDGIFIGCTMNHSVADGTSFWHFFNSWSEICRGFIHMSKIPVFERWLPINGSISPPIRFSTSSIRTKSASIFVPPQLHEQNRVFHFTKSKVAELKAKANAEAGVRKVSSLQSLLAHVWRSVTRNRRVDPDREIVFTLAVGLRQRLQPQLSEERFGNLVVLETMTMKAKEVLEHGLGYVALEMNKVISGFTKDYVKTILDSWMENPELVTAGSFTSNLSLLTSSSPRFNIYGTDFGWGRPVAVRCGPENKSDGKITLFPGVEEGSVDIEVCLLPETMRAMENDMEFMGSVTM